MDYEKLINDFIDGTLDSANEEKLFMAVSSNDELRNELKMQLAMKSAIKTDKKAMTPSARSTMGVFGALGFTAPIAAPAPEGFFTKVGSFFSKYTQGFIGSAIGAATIATLLYFVNPWNSSENSSINNPHKETATVQKDITIPLSYSSDAKDKKQDNNENSINSQKPIEKVVYKYIYVDKDEEEKIIEEVEIVEKISEPKPAPLELASLFEKPKSNSDYFKRSLISNEPNKLLQNSNNNSSLTLNKPDNYYILGNNLGIGFEFHGSQYWFMRETNISPSKLQSFNNAAFSAMYSPMKNWRFGLEYRRENFYQIFQGTNAEGDLFQYEQQPNFETWSLFTRYYPEFNWQILSPFVQLSGGLNKAGAVGRLALGAEFSPNPGYTFVFGIDGSLLSYHHQSKTYQTGKIGLIFGVGLNL